MYLAGQLEKLYKAGGVERNLGWLLREIAGDPAAAVIGTEGSKVGGLNPNCCPVIGREC